MRPRCCLVLLSFLLGCKGCDRVAGIGPAEPSAMILVLDGVRSEEFSSYDRVSDLTGLTGEQYASETWAALGPDMASMSAALNPGITITAPGHAQMVTGRLAPYANFAVSDGPGLYLPEYPTIFEELRGQLGVSAEEAVFLGNTELLQGEVQSIQPSSAAFAGHYNLLYDPEKPNAPINDDTPMVEAIEVAVTENRPRLLVANFHDVDRAGHYGAGDAYIEDVKKLDGLIPELWAWLGENDPEYRDNLLVFITADHGRHRHDGDDGWHNHGDTCSGCREVPLLVLGADAVGGTALAGSWTLLDLAPTIAAHVGFDAPWSEGLPIDEVINGGTVRQGDVDLSRDATAWTHYLADDIARNEVIVDGAVVSTAGAMFAEGVTAGEVAGMRGARAACWRELTVDPAELYWPWLGNCLFDTGDGWVEAGFPEEGVAQNWRPQFLAVEDQIWVVYNNNEDGIGELGADNSVGIRARSWSEEAGWSTPLATAQYFPTDPAAVVTADGTVIVAFGTNLPGDEARYSRRVRVNALDVTTGWSTGVDIDISGVIAGARVERPALRVGADTVQIAVVATTEADNLLVVQRSEDLGATWGSSEIVSSNPVLPHLSPQWVGAELFWGALGDDGNAAICWVVPGNVETCVGLGSPRLDSFSADTRAAVIDVGVAEWERVAF